VSIEPTEPAATADASRAATLTFVLEAEPSRFSPVAGDAPTQRVNELIYDALYRLDGQLRPVPDLAAALPAYDKAGTTWTVKLRPEVLFHDGSVLTSADVVATYRMAISPNCPFADLCPLVGATLSQVAAPDPATVTFTLRARSAPFLALVLARLPILPQAAVGASLQRWQDAAGTLEPDLVTALTERIAAATNDEDCIAEAPPPECDLAFYAADLEAMLRQAGVALPESARFPAANGEVDRSAYAAELLLMAQDLDAALRGKDIDRLAAAFPLLDFQRRPVGTGDYALRGYRPGQSVELERVTPDAGRAGVPEAARGLIITDPAAAATALKTGDADWLAVASPDEVPALESDPAVRVAGRPGAGYRGIVFNTRAGRPYAAAEARRAFAMCVDRERDVRAATSGRATVAPTPVAPGSWAWIAPVSAPRRSAAAARRSLQEAGWKLGADGIFVREGLRLSSELWVRPSRADQRAFAEAASQQLRACGIELQVRDLGFSGDQLLRQLEWPNDFDTYLLAQELGGDPHQDLARLHSRHITSEANPGDTNFGGWNDPRADQLIDAGATTLDPVERARIYAELQELIASEVPLYPCWYDVVYSGLSRRVSLPAGQPDLAQPGFDLDPESWRLRPAAGAP
jgi:ABC-type transport system substrate-binding protein